MEKKQSKKIGRTLVIIALAAASIITVTSLAGVYIIRFLKPVTEKVIPVAAGSSGASESSASQPDNPQPGSVPSAASQSSAVSAAPSSAPVNSSFKGAVFMGDSLTIDMINYSEVADANVVASTGVSSYKALTDHQVAINNLKTDLAWMPERVASFHPARVYMLFGLNDLCWGEQMAETTFAGYYAKLVDKARSIMESFF